MGRTDPNDSPKNPLFNMLGGDQWYLCKKRKAESEIGARMGRVLKSSGKENPRKAKTEQRLQYDERMSSFLLEFMVHHLRKQDKAE